MYRVGDGTAPLTNVATVVFLDEFTTAGTFVQSIRMPVEPGGANHILTASGTSTAEGMLTRSTDGSYIVLTGYDKAPGGTNPSADPPATTNRVIGRVAANAAVDTTTALDDPTNSMRSATSTNGTALWMTASGNGSRYTTLGTTTSTQLATTPTNLRATAIFGGQLYVSSATGAFQGISTVGTGLPTTEGQTITLLNGFPTAAGPSPMQFAFFDANTLYVADDRNIASGGGVQKWTQSGGLWTLVTTLNNGLTAGVRGLTLAGTDAIPIIYATTADSPSKLVTVTDDGSGSPAVNLLATTGASTAWRGIAFAPNGGVSTTPTPTPPPATPTPTPTPTPATPTPSPSPSPSPTPASPYAGTWTFSHTPTSITNTTCDPGPVGVPVNDGVWPIDNLGRFAFVSGQTAIDGLVQSDGTWSATLGATGGCTMAGTASGTCSSTAFCSGTYDYSGNMGTFQFRRANSSFDFDGDGQTDVSVWRPSAGQWWLYRSTAGVLGVSFGDATDTPRAADFDGDGRTDIAFFRGATSEWYVLRSDDFSYYAFPFGTTGDIPVVGDFDGDGRADATVYRPTEATWYILQSSNKQLLAVPFGLNGDIPVPADYDGDGRSDIAIYRPNVGEWWILRSSDSSVLAATFGESTDKPVAGDYTGDGRADIAFFRPSEGNWYVLRSEDFSYFAFPWGNSTDKPAPGDYDGDGKFDAAIFRPSDTTWYILESSGGTSAVPFGLPDDVPVPGQSIP
jgi:hypothetical protein